MADESAHLPKVCPWCGNPVASLTTPCPGCGRLPDWRAWVDSVHAHAQLLAPPGWEGLHTTEPLDSISNIGGYLRRDLAALRILGDNGRSPYWLERANELYANVFRALDAQRIANRPEQQPKANDCDEAEHRLAELWRWCATQGGDAAPAEPANDASAPTKSKLRRELGEAGSDDQATMRLLSVFTDGVADERLLKAATVLKDKTLTTNEKLAKIDDAIRFPSTASAAQLGELFGVTKQAVMKTDWWTTNRKGERESEIGRRHDKHCERGKQHESNRPDEKGDQQ